MANFTTTPGVVLNDREQKIVQNIANCLNANFPDKIVLQKMFRVQAAYELDISIQDAQAFTLC